MDIVVIEERDNDMKNNENNQTYVKSQGMSQTIIQKPGVNSNISQVNWDADYNGKVANLNLDVNTNGKKDNYIVQLTKGDLENLLSVPSVEKSLEERLEDDFLMSENFVPKLQYKPQPYLFRPSVYPKENQNSIESRINDELNKISSQDEESLKLEINNLLNLKKKLQHPYKGKHNHSHYKSQHHRKKSKLTAPIKHQRLTTKTKKNNYKTPSPKTIRIHLTDDHNVSSPSSTHRRKSKKKRKSSSHSSTSKKETSFLGRISDLIQN